MAPMRNVASLASADYQDSSGDGVYNLLVAYPTQAAADSSLLRWQQWVWCAAKAANASWAWGSMHAQSYCNGVTPALGSMGAQTPGDASTLHAYLAVWSCKNVVCQTMLTAPAGGTLDSASFLSTIIETGSENVQRLVSGS